MRFGARIAWTLIAGFSALLGPVPLATAQATDAPGSREETLEYVAADTVKIEGVLVLPDLPQGADGAPAPRWPVAVLVHPLNRNRDGLIPLADALARSGFASIVIDLRGHGRSTRWKGGALYSFNVRPGRELHLAVDDLARALDAVRERPDLDLDRVAYVGVGQGAMIAAEAASRSAAVKALVLVDPSRPGSGFDPQRDLGLYGARPALLVASAYPQSRAITRALVDFGDGERKYVESDSFESKDRLLTPDIPVLGEICGWLATRVGPPEVKPP